MSPYCNSNSSNLPPPKEYCAGVGSYHLNSWPLLPSHPFQKPRTKKSRKEGTQSMRISWQRRNSRKASTATYDICCSSVKITGTKRNVMRWKVVRGKGRDLFCVQVVRTHATHRKRTDRPKEWLRFCKFRD